MADVTPPVPISYIQDHYMLYDTDTIAYLRREHNLCGVLIGTIPHVSQQNIFLGVPLELMPEEARALVEKGVAYIVDDAQAHKEGIWGLNAEEQKAFKDTIERQGREIALAGKIQAEKRKEEHFKKAHEKTKKAGKKKDEPKGLLDFGEDESAVPVESSPDPTVEHPDEASSLFPTPPRTPNVSDLSTAVEQWHITPLTSHPPLPTKPQPSSQLPVVPKSYPLYSHLYKKGYFLTPGLRFGCNYCVYPGDPLRYHSHFLAVGKEWDEEFDLLDLVGGGRLGTAVKKGYLIGGREVKEKDANESTDDEDKTADVRTFCIEWAGM